jgi:hypothetical protein
MNMSDITNTAKSILSAVAPTMASAFLGPMGGIATQKLISALGLAPDSTHEQTMQALAGATPDQLLEIKKAEQEFIVDMKRLDVDILRLEAEDKDSARRREVETQDWTPRVIAALILGLYVTVQWYILGNVIEASMREIVLRSMGTLDAAVGLVLGYYFGSSIGSHAKDKTIESMQGKS